MKKEDIAVLAHETMTLCLDRDHQVFEQLRVQYRNATINSIDDTVVGFFVNYDIPDDVERLPNNMSFNFGAYAHMKGLEHGVMMTAFVRDGALDWIEGKCFEKSMPETLEDFEISPDKESIERILAFAR